MSKQDGDLQMISNEVSLEYVQIGNNFRSGKYEFELDDGTKTILYLTRAQAKFMCNVTLRSKLKIKNLWLREEIHNSDIPKWEKIT